VPEPRTLMTGLVVGESQGLDKLDELFRSRTGRLLTAPAPAPGVGWP
jgi:hypothetical protein